MTLLRNTLLALAGLASVSLAQAAEAPQLAPGTAPAAASGYREFIYGQPTAKVTVIEYASLTCPHCARFAQVVFPMIKKNYIDTGKIRFVFRDYPLDALAMVGAVLARCAPEDRGKKLIEMIYKNQDTWIRAEKPSEPLKGYAQLAGMTGAEVDACLKNKPLIDAIQEQQDKATNLYKVEKTPTFFVGDEKVDGLPEGVDSDNNDRGYAFLAKALDKHLAKGN